MDRRAPSIRQQFTSTGLVQAARASVPLGIQNRSAGHPGGRADRSLQPALVAQRGLGAISPGGRGLVAAVGPALSSVLNTEDTKCSLSGGRV